MTLSLCRWPARLGWAALAATCLHAAPALANDGPFLRLDTALVEDDDERTYEVSSRYTRTPGEQHLGVQLEYNFSPTLSAEVEMGWARERGGPDRERELELSLKHNWIDPNRAGWGLSGRLGLAWGKDSPDAWRYGGPTAVLIASLPVADGQGHLHANWGVSRERPSTRALWALGADWALTRRVSLLAEVAGRVNEDRVGHGGVRWWLQREKLALDVTLSRTRDFASGDSVRGAHVALSFYDLSF